MDLFNFNPAQILSFLLTLIRISLILFFMPFFGAEAAPKAVKGALCLVITLALWPSLSFPGTQMPTNPWSILLIVFNELILGMTLGLAIQFVFAGVQTSGQFLGFQMGFTISSIADPMTGVQEPTISHFLYTVAILCFICLNGHLYLLAGIAESFKVIPAGSAFFGQSLFDEVVNLSTQLFTLAIKIAAPVIAILFLVELALALMARAAPQMNLLIIGFPLKIGVGLFFMGLIFTLVAEKIQIFVTDIVPILYNLLKAATPPV